MNIKIAETAKKKQKETKQLFSYLKSNDKTKSDSKELPVEQCVVSTVVSIRFISKNKVQLLQDILCNCITSLTVLLLNIRNTTLCWSNL